MLRRESGEVERDGRVGVSRTVGRWGAILAESHIQNHRGRGGPLGVACSYRRLNFENGIDTLAKFAANVTSEEELTRVPKANFGLDPEASLKVRGQVASYLVAWQTAKTRIKMQAETEAIAS